jgi:Ser/Thr protein kinase RdoA (MazF antagonist)
MKPDWPALVQRFQFEGEFREVRAHGAGHIHDTYVAQFVGRTGSDHRYIVQRINQHVFRDVVGLMQNIERVTAHLREKVIAAGGDARREVLRLIPTTDGETFCRTGDGGHWRGFRFVEGVQALERIENLDHVHSVARAFGRFQQLLEDFPGGQLIETIPDFHHTRKRFDALVAAIEADAANRARFARPEIAFAEERAEETEVLLDLHDQGRLPGRVTHNDTKFNNVLIDEETGEGVCVIDLDTVMPGLSLYDFGDMVRSAACFAREDETDLSGVGLHIPAFQRCVQGYLEAGRSFLTSAEVDHMAFSAKLMTLENGLRFLTDFLNGDIYFRTRTAFHNLDRCRSQFKLVSDMEQRFDQMQGIVETFR